MVKLESNCAYLYGGSAHSNRLLQSLLLMVGTGGALFRQRKQSMATEMAKTGDFFFPFRKKHWRMKNVHINVRPHILLPKVVSVKNSHFSTENANVVT